jgi:hypothetical protein
MPAHAGGERHRRTKLTRNEKIIRWILAGVAVLIGLCVLGNLLPAHHEAEPTAPAVGSAPATLAPKIPRVPALVTVERGHVRAVVQATGAGRELILCNTGTGWASAKFSLSDLAIQAKRVTVTNVVTGIGWGPVAAVRVTLTPDQVVAYILK